MHVLEQQLRFLFELDRLKAVYRQSMVASDNYRYENSAEHSWHIALLAQVLQEYAEQVIDINRVVNMLLIHDIVEIDAGDTFAFSQRYHSQEQADQESLAAHRIFGLLPPKQSEYMQQLWFEFEAAETADARFAKAMDRLLPFMQNMAVGGGSWCKYQVTKTQVIKRNADLQEIAPKLWAYFCQQLEIAVAKGWLLDE